MQVTVRLFAAAREAAKCERQVLDLPDGATATLARTRLREVLPMAASVLDTAALAVNQKYARGDQPLSDGDELAVLPPVSGG